METMKKSVIAITLVILCSLTCPTMAVAQKPMDIPTLELLIDWHKRKYDKLSERADREAAKNVVVKKAQELSEGYEDLHKRLTSRYTSYMAWGSVGISVLSLSKDLKKCAVQLQMFAIQVKYVKNMYVLREYIRTIEGLRVQYKYLWITIRMIPLLRANPKELQEIIIELQSSLTAINSCLYSCNFMVQGYKALEEMNYRQDPIDKAKIATQIIRDYSK